MASTRVRACGESELDYLVLGIFGVVGSTETPTETATPGFHPGYRGKNAQTAKQYKLLIDGYGACRGPGQACSVHVGTGMQRTVHILANGVSNWARGP